MTITKAADHVTQAHAVFGNLSEHLHGLHADAYDQQIVNASASLIDAHAYFCNQVARPYLPHPEGKATPEIVVLSGVAMDVRYLRKVLRDNHDYDGKAHQLLTRLLTEIEHADAELR